MLYHNAKCFERSKSLVSKRLVFVATRLRSSEISSRLLFLCGFAVVVVLSSSMALPKDKGDLLAPTENVMTQYPSQPLGIAQLL
jgi:hypothetical protein